MNDPGQLVVAILGLIATVAIPIVVSRQTHPRRQVRYFVEVLNDEALLAGADGISLSPLVGRPDLAVVSVRLWSSGRVDIPSSAFDGGKPLVFQFSSAIEDDALPPSPWEVAGWGFERSGERELLLQPTVIGRANAFQTLVAVRQPVYYQLHHPLLDVDVITDANHTGPSTRRRRGIHFTTIRVGAGLLILAFASLFIALIWDTVIASTNPNASDQDYAFTTVFIILLFIFFFAGSVTLIVGLIIRFARRKARRKASTATRISGVWPG